MQVELKNIKHFESMSQETNCFTATVYVDGKKACTVSNEGHGGSNMWSDWKIRDRITANFKPLGPVITDIADPTTASGKFEMERDADTVVDGLLTDWLVANDLKKAMRNRVLYIKEDGAIYETKRLDAATHQRYLAMPDLAAKLKATKVLNQLPFEEALEIYKKTAS